MALKIQVFKCGRCGKPRGLTHTCVTRLNRRTKPGKTRIKPRAALTTTCRTCGQPRGLLHTCHVSTDFKKRKAEAARKQAAARKRKQAARRKATAAARRNSAPAKPGRARTATSSKPTAQPTAQPTAKAAGKAGASKPTHDHRTCQDTDCRRYACQIWKEAFAEAMAIGLENGYQQAAEQRQPIPQDRPGGKPRMSEWQIKSLVADHFAEDNVRPDEIVLLPNGDILIDRRKTVSWAKPHVVGRWKP
ncbi:hypothetical protein [Actinomadura rupiterrae]|uniref:hypothetical protein n=1 Tax=Actinomadura rupiterrae TaxID=559627 RepID=UPI0020A371A6|nr:hypothetical protein [Actinomadura rupiterrae]MCP2336978.1 hypothetical protein [Actinomadura rupiterrae]